MQLRKVISICIAGMALTAVHAQPAAFQGEGATKATTKKSKKVKKATNAASNAESSAASTAAGVANEPTGKADRAASAATNTAKTAASTPAKTVSESEIAAAKASGKVWVNTATGVYHKSGRWYGATKQGKFMSEQDAIQAGFHAAKTK